MRTLAWLAAISLTCTTPAADAESMRDFWRERAPMAVLVSSKSAAALEMCLGLEGGETGAPVVLHGERETLITIVQPGQMISTLMGFRIVEEGTSRKVEVWARGSTLGTWTKRAAEAARLCTA